MKMRISVAIENEDGSAFADPTTIEVSVPEVEAFTSPKVFDQVFDQYERKVLEARPPSDYGGLGKLVDSETQTR